MSQTILIADDSKTVRTIVKMAFKASGYDVAEQGEGANVLSTVQSARPNILILDYYFPDGDGYDICRDLKENPATADIPILMLGGKYKQFNEGLARTSGADAVLHKPFKTDALLQGIEEAKAKCLENLAKRGIKPASAAPPSSPAATRFAGAPPVGGSGGFGAGAGGFGGGAPPVGSAGARFGAPASSPSANSAATVGPGNLPPMAEKPSFGTPNSAPPATPFSPSGGPPASFGAPSSNFGNTTAKPPSGFGGGGFGAGAGTPGGVLPQVPPPEEGPPSQEPVISAAPVSSAATAPPPATPAPASPAVPVAASAPAAGGGVDAEFVRKIIREEIEAFVKDELPGLVQNVLGGPIQRKLLYKMIARADERYDEVVRGAVHNQVIIEIEKLLNESN